MNTKSQKEKSSDERTVNRLKQELSFVASFRNHDSERNQIEKGVEE
jgi:hypothetical protein